MTTILRRCSPIVPPRSYLLDNLLLLLDIQGLMHDAVIQALDLSIDILQLDKLCGRDEGSEDAWDRDTCFVDARETNTCSKSGAREISSEQESKV